MGCGKPLMVSEIDLLQIEYLFKNHGHAYMQYIPTDDEEAWASLAYTTAFVFQRNYQKTADFYQHFNYEEQPGCLQRADCLWRQVDFLFENAAREIKPATASHH